MLGVGQRMGQLEKSHLGTLMLHDHYTDTQNVTVRQHQAPARGSKAYSGAKVRRGQEPEQLSAAMIRRERRRKRLFMRISFKKGSHRRGTVPDAECEGTWVGASDDRACPGLCAWELCWVGSQLPASSAFCVSPPSIEHSLRMSGIEDIAHSVPVGRGLTWLLTVPSRNQEHLLRRSLVKGASGALFQQGLERWSEVNS